MKTHISSHQTRPSSQHSGRVTHRALCAIACIALPLVLLAQSIDPNCVFSVVFRNQCDQIGSGGVSSYAGCNLYSIPATNQVVMTYYQTNGYVAYYTTNVYNGHTYITTNYTLLNYYVTNYATLTIPGSNYCIVVNPTPASDCIQITWDDGTCGSWCVANTYNTGSNVSSNQFTTASVTSRTADGQCTVATNAYGVIVCVFNCVNWTPIMSGSKDVAYCFTTNCPVNPFE